MPTLIGPYLHSKGVKRVVMELLHQLGITVSYDATMSNIRTLSRSSTEDVALAGQASDTVTVYDNFEQMEGVRERGMEDNRSFSSVTASEVFEGLGIPSGGLNQDMLDPHAELSIKQAEQLCCELYDKS